MTTSNGGDAGSRVSIPADLRETFQNIRDYTGKQHSDEDIFSVFKDCFNDPHETAQKLLFLDTFHEVRSKRERKKENLIVPKTQEKGRNGRRNFASNYTGDCANNGRSAAFRRQSGANHRLRGSGAASPAPSRASSDSSIKECNPVIPPSRVSNPKITEEHTPSKSASSSEDVAELTKSKASETVPVSDSVVQNDTQYTVNGTSMSSQQSAISDCGSQSDQVTRSEPAAHKGNNQSLLKSDVGERPHVTFPVHLQVAKTLENGLTFGSFGSNFVKETSCDKFTFGRDDSTIKSSRGTASYGSSDRKDVSTCSQENKDHEISNAAPETELQLVEGSEVDKLNEESLPIKDAHQAANCDGPPISYPDQSSIAASQHAMNLFRQQYPLNFFPYGLYYPPPFYMPQPYVHQFLTPNGFQQQSHLPAQDNVSVPHGDKLPLPQIKSGTNIGYSPPTTFPSPYDSYTASFNHISSAATVDSTNKEEKKEDYITGQLSLANLQGSAMYNLSLQGHHPLAFPTLQAGFTGIYQQTQPTLQAPSPMNEQPIGPPIATNQQPQAAPTNMDNNY
ncbi:GBF-interacting protein 1 [Hirschfeldia incana]|nr:GBF-interacting protein 1 [Hirschfeldia incana]